MSLAAAHALLAGCARGGEEDEPYAMQMVLNLPKTDTPGRTDVLEAAARAVVGVCLEEEFAPQLEPWYGRRIRKVARRARNKAWEDVQAIPGVTVARLVRAFPPGPVNAVERGIGKLQIGGTDLPPQEVGPALDDAPVIYVDASLGMSVGKAAAQVGHGSMLLAAAMPLEWVEEWAARDFVLSVREVDRETFAAACVRADAVPVRDAGYTEVAPGSVTVVALPRP